MDRTVQLTVIHKLLNTPQVITPHKLTHPTSVRRVRAAVWGLPPTSWRLHRSQVKQTKKKLTVTVDI
jgi:hypothetical protein